MPEPGAASESFYRTSTPSLRDVYRLRLYVTGASRLSLLAVANIKRLCEQHLAGRYELEIIDLYQQPEVASREQLLVAPTLIKMFPLPVRRLIGSLADQPAVLRSLDLPA
jgi:circadian clock protein KaiB